MISNLGELTCYWCSICFLACLGTEKDKEKFEILFSFLLFGCGSLQNYSSVGS